MDENNIKQHPLVEEMLGYMHPSLAGTRYEEGLWKQLNVFAWTERVDGGDNSKPVYRASLGIAVSIKNYPISLELAGFTSTAANSTDEAKNDAIAAIYHDFQIWSITQTEDHKTWRNPPPIRFDK